LQDLAAAEGEELPREVARTHRRVADRLDLGATVLVRLREQQVAVADHRRHQVVEVVRDTTRELPDRVHIVRLPELSLELAAIGARSNTRRNRRSDSSDLRRSRSRSRTMKPPRNTTPAAITTIAISSPSPLTGAPARRCTTIAAGTAIRPRPSRKARRTGSDGPLSLRGLIRAGIDGCNAAT